LEAIHAIGEVLERPDLEQNEGKAVLAARRAAREWEFVERLMKGRTTLAVAHRLSPIRHAELMAQQG
jgi:hypothetical protein